LQFGFWTENSKRRFRCGKSLRLVRTACGSGWFKFIFKISASSLNAEVRPPATAGGSDLISIAEKAFIPYTLFTILDVQK
jgi:hypothetical protein